jgi:hypothetical protein
MSVDEDILKVEFAEDLVPQGKGESSATITAKCKVFWHTGRVVYNGVHLNK